MLENHTATMKSLIPNLSADLDHSIKTFLARPYLFATKVIGTTNPANYVIQLFNLYADFMSIPYYSSKLRGLAGFRATTHIRVQSNANRFQQGRLLINYFPGTVTSTKYQTINDSLMSRTQLPRVEMDINTTDECTLSVPFVSDRPFYDFRDSTQSTGGHVGVVVYSPLQSGSGGELTFHATIWVHFTDVELFWPGDIVPQSGVVSTTLRRKNRNNPEAEVPAAHKPISGFFSKVSNATGILSKIPLLSSIATPISWSTRIVSDAAAAMGWSKPNSCQQQRYAISQCSGWTNGSGVNLGLNLGLLEDNKVAILEDMGGTTLDQMSIKYPLSIPTYLTTVTVRTADTTGSVVFSKQATPANFFSVTTSGFAQHNTPLCYFAKMFQFWRGGIRVRLKAVKTEFHTGRYRFVVAPKPILAGDTMAYYISEIIDLRDASEWTFDVPYMSSLPYLPTKYWVNNRASTGAWFGLITVNQLRCPETCADNVNIIIEVSGSEDFEFAGPMPPNNTQIAASPVVPVPPGGLTTIQTPANNDYESGNLYAQGPEEVDAQYVCGDYPIANTPTYAPSLEPSKMCIGERITSLKQLALKPTYLASTNFPGMAIKPDNPTAICYSGKIGTWVEKPTYYDMVRLCYGFYRGGVSVKITGASATAIVHTRNYADGSSWPTIPSGSARALPNVLLPFKSPIYSGPQNILGTPAQAAYNTSSQGVVDVVMPHYSIRPVRRNPLLVDKDSPNVGDTWLSIDDGRILYYNENPPSGLLQDQNGVLKHIFISASDDFQCNFFTGCPMTNAPAYAIAPISDSTNNPVGIANNTFI